MHKGAAAASRATTISAAGRPAAVSSSSCAAFINATSRTLSGPISRNTAILSLRYPISRDTFQGRLALPQNGAIPLFGVYFSQPHFSAIPHFAPYRAIPHFATYRAIIVRYPTKTSTKKKCDTIATSIARYEKYRCWASKVVQPQSVQQVVQTQSVQQVLQPSSAQQVLPPPSVLRKS